MAAITRRQYTGNAVATTITAQISASATSCTLAATTGWPNTPSVPFFVVIDPGNSAEEKCLATISGSTLTLSRNKDDTNNVIHDANAVIYPVFTATEANEANLVASTMIARGDLLTMDSATTVTRLPIGATSGYVLTTNGTDPSWSQVVAAGIATNAVTSDKILAGSVTPGKLSSYPKLIIPHTFTVGGPVNVQSGQLDYILPFFVRVPATQTVKLISARHRINSGTSATAKVQVNGSDATGFTGMVITTTSTDTDPADITLSNNDLVSLVVTAVSGAPQNMSVTVFFEYTWTG